MNLWPRKKRVSELKLFGLRNNGWVVMCRIEVRVMRCLDASGFGVVISDHTKAIDQE